MSHKKLSNNKKRQLQQMVAEAAQALMLQRPLQCEAICLKALKIDPTHADALNLLGKTAELKGNNSEAMASYERGLNSNPKHLNLLASCAQLHNRTGKYRDAISCWERYTALRPESSDAWQALSCEWYALREWEKAEEAIRRAIRLAPEKAALRMNIGQVLLQQNRRDEAVEQLQKATALAPDDAECWFSLAIPLLQSGAFEEATTCLLKAIEINPLHAEALSRLLRFTDHSHIHDTISKAEYAFNNSNVQIPGRIMVGFGLGKAREDLGDFDKAFLCYEKANALRHQYFPYNGKSEEQKIEAIIELYSEQNIEASPVESSSGKEMIFIVGMPRCGSTLIAQILAAHPDATDTGETEFLRDACINIAADSEKRPDLSSLANIAATDAASLAGQYLRNVHNQFGPANRYIDKALPNFELLGIIRRIFPAAKIIHCMRDPMDTCFSIYSNLFQGMAFNYAYDQKETVHAYQLYSRLAEHWRDTLPADHYLELSYEQLIHAPEDSIRSILHFCDLDWDEACLNFHQSEQSVTTSSLAQVRQPLYQSSIGRWKRFEKHLQPMHEALKP